MGRMLHTAIAEHFQLSTTTPCHAEIVRKGLLYIIKIVFMYVYYKLNSWPGIMSNLCQ